jgi:iterative type I PKS product template protein
MAFTLARRIQNEAFGSKFSGMGINVANFEYHDPVVPHPNSSDPHAILVNAEASLENGEVRIKWFNPANDKWYCHATAYYEDASAWLSNWARTTMLVTSRIDALNSMSNKGTASKLTTHLAYTLFGKLVDYSSMYRTMQSVILNEDEAVAEVIFPSDTQGDWVVPPHFIDGLVSLSGFILNGGSHFDNINNFFITPSWKSMRFARPLTPGGRYLAYTRMVPEAVNDSSKLSSYVGDVYILQDGEIVGMVEAILFRQWPRVMLNRFFRPAGAALPAAPTNKKIIVAPSSLPSASLFQEKTIATAVVANLAARHPATVITPPLSRPSFQSTPRPKGISQLDYLLTPGDSPVLDGLGEKSDSDSGYEEADGVDDVASRAIHMLAEELAVDIGLLTDECEIADIGLDSLMSLVISQKLREDLGIEIRDAFYLEVTTIGDLKKLVS